jgi:tetratricopeptide (TPR) repeat protein
MRILPPFAAPRGLSRGFAALLSALIVCVVLLPSPAPAQSETRSAASEEAREAGEINPSAWKLGPEALRLYYYLLVSIGISDDNSPLVDAALKGLLHSDPSLDLFLDGAALLAEKEELTAAAEITRQGLRHYPHDPRLNMLLAGIYAEQGDIAGAIAHLEGYVRKNPENKEAAVRELIQLYLDAGEEDKALALLDKEPALSESRDDVYFRAKVLSSVGRDKEAGELLLSLLQRYPNYEDAWIELGRLREKTKDDAGAIEAYRKAIAAGKEKRQGSGKDRANPEMLLRIATLQIRDKLPKEALQTLETPLPPLLLVDAAMRFAAAKYYDEARLLLTRAGEEGANKDEIALVSSMITQESAENPLEALKDLERIGPESKLYPSALQQKARIYLQVKEYAKAHQTARMARELFPEVRELWGLEAYALVKMQEGPEAEKLLREALARYPDDEHILYSLGVVQDESDKKAEALRTMEQIIAVNPANYQALNYVGYTLAENNRDLDRARALITAALEQNPEAYYIVDSLAWVQYRQGKFQEAWDSINRSIALGGDEATIWEHYGDIAKALHKKDEAIKGYSEALARDPNNVTELRRKLVSLKAGKP